MKIRQLRKKRKPYGKYNYIVYAHMEFLQTAMRNRNMGHHGLISLKEFMYGGSDFLRKNVEPSNIKMKVKYRSSFGDYRNLGFVIYLEEKEDIMLLMLSNQDISIQKIYEVVTSS